MGIPSILRLGGVDASYVIIRYLQMENNPGKNDWMIALAAMILVLLVIVPVLVGIN
jgi:hypothetical protein